MESIIRLNKRLVDTTSTKFIRYLYHEIEWSNRLIGISGARGTGKTTLLLQYIKLGISDKSKALYASLDNIWFTTHTLSDLVEQCKHSATYTLAHKKAHKAELISALWAF